MFEGNSTKLDAGTLPFNMNTNETLTFVDAQPVYEDDFSTLLDTNPKNIANGTKVDAWHDVDGTYVPTGSQTDTEIVIDWNETMEDGYFAEIRRELDTGNADDIVLDFANDELWFYLGAANGDDTFDMFIDVEEYLVCLTNEAPGLTFTAITADPVTESLVITGGVYDDYAGYALVVEMTGWEDTYGAGAYDLITVNEATGNYSYLFVFNEDDMPLGENTIFVTLYPLYDAPIQLNQTIEIDDIKAPVIQGIVDVGANYPNGVPLDAEYVTVTVGLSDDYAFVDDIAANLYSYKGNDVALQTDMVQFSSGGNTFNANITIEHTPGVVNNYTYFIQAWDTNLNKVTSDHYWFLVASEAPTPAFGIIAGLFGLAASVFIIKKFKK